MDLEFLPIVFAVPTGEPLDPFCPTACVDMAQVEEGQREEVRAFAVPLGLGILEAPE